MGYFIGEKVLGDTLFGVPLGFVGGSLCVRKKKSGCCLGSPLAGFGPPCSRWWVVLAVGRLAFLPGRSCLARCLRLFFVCAVWGLLCLLLPLSRRCPSSVLCPLSPVLCRLLPLCLVLGGLLLLVWLLWCGLVRTLSLLCARMVALVCVVRRTLLRRLVVLCLRMLCSPGCRPVLGRLSGSVLRLATRLTSGLLVLKEFEMREFFEAVACVVIFAAIGVMLAWRG